ncbi:MAG: hypothetical protein KKD39_04790 [Candidatus Altiarchaeota archaeon]|nr:hypothetical protein [Candidatus Altiarchaeota archaeon]
MGQDSFFDRILYIGFIVGLCIVLLGLAIFYLPFIKDIIETIKYFLDYYNGFWRIFYTFPKYIQYIIIGSIIIGIVALITVIRASRKRSET